MKLMIATAAAAVSLAGSAFADNHAGVGDPAAGEKEFNKCKSCHMIVSDDGTEIVKGGRTGPNLWNVIGRQAGTYEDFRYGDSIVAAGEKGLVWDEESFVAYTQDPKGFLSDYLGESARSKMSFKLRKGAEDVYAYLVSVSPEPEEGS
ncbi:cytochrome C [Marivita sp. GX14005]|uniref:c-type cytochrome n=1 Tax=Marivita sp. GX14005 TaxID=2942276 RepID=UPI00201923C4|nr:cytochrome C [Marivita sp. GX14005]MCL3881653.1 cytochrome C [Marivita sp. GX14005]